MSINSSEAYWMSALAIFTATAIFVANAVLIHRSGRTKSSRVIRPLLRHTMRHRTRSRSASLTNTASPLLVSATEQQQQQQLKRNEQQQQKPQQPSAIDNRASPPKPYDEEDEWWGAAARWVRWDPNPTTRAVVQGWIDTGDKDSATRLLLGKRLAFGTSGLRGAMGPGYCRMNDLVVIQTTQGLCHYLEEEGGEEFKKRGVVIGRDHRKQEGVSSEEFARLAAAVFASQGFRVYFMGGTTGITVATPLVAFGVSHLEACAGVMVTASHNPKKDNGYKVYWGNGSQIIPPRDAGIASSIERNLEPWETYDPASATAGPLCSDPIDAVTEAYFQGIGDQLCRRRDANARSGLEVVYSAMHGVADHWARRAFHRFSLPPFLSVESQKDPDPEFPTVAFPNPEEPGALKEAMALAEKKGVSLVLANDPDGDRLAAAERQPSGRWHVFSGNEIGVLLGLWQWEEWRRTHPDEDPSKAVMIASTVSSKMLSAAADREGFTFEETLPGFKWMAHRGQELKAQGKTVLFAYEEAIGFGPGDVVFEKDGLSSAALFAEMFVALRDRDSQALQSKPQPELAIRTDLPDQPGQALPLPHLEDTRDGPTKPDEDRAGNGAAVSNATAPPSPCCTTATVGAKSQSSPSTSPEDDMASALSPEDEATSSPSPQNEVTSSPFPGNEGMTSSPITDHAVSCACEGERDEGQQQDQQQERLPGFSSVLVRRLQELHARYGEFAEENGYVRCDDAQVVSNIFSRLREGESGTYRSSFGGHKVTGVRDLSEGHGFDSDSPDGRPKLPLVGGGAHFLTFRLGNEGVVGTLRTSGTEPKIKFYLEMQGKPGVPLEQVSVRLSEIASVFVDEALEPERWAMKRVALS